MKRSISILLVLVLLVSALTFGAGAASAKAPVYTSYSDINYMAHDILSQMDLAGKSDRDQILTVYTWIIDHCRRHGDPDPAHYDPSIADTPEFHAFVEDYVAKLEAGTYLRRPDPAMELITADYPSYFLLSVDCNDLIAPLAGELMMYRVGHCQHFASLLTVLLEQLGFDCRVIGGDYVSGGSATEHKWNMVLLDGQYYWLDVRMDQVMKQSIGTMPYFLVADDSQWAQSHSWDHSYSDSIKAKFSHAPVAPAPSDTLWSRCSPWAEPYLQRCGEQSIYPACFRGADMTRPISRRDFASVVVLFYEALSGQTAAPCATVPFTDISAADTDILKAYELKIVDGYGDGKYHPDDTLRRDQAMTMLGRVCELVLSGAVTRDGSGLHSNPAATSIFKDREQIADWALPYVRHLVSNGSVNGVSADTFAPTQNMTREQAMKIAVECLQ